MTNERTIFGPPQMRVSSDTFLEPDQLTAPYRRSRDARFDPGGRKSELDFEPRGSPLISTPSRPTSRCVTTRQHVVRTGRAPASLARPCDPGPCGCGSG